MNGFGYAPTISILEGILTVTSLDEFATITSSIVNSPDDKNNSSVSGATITSFVVLPIVLKSATSALSVSSILKSEP